jgi:transcription antitermination factor NusG
MSLEITQKWFALYVKPRHEKVVDRALHRVGFESFLPLHVLRHVYAHCSKEHEIPLFPGYVFCRFDPLKRTPILSTPGVISILSVARKPVPVDDVEIFALQSAMKAQLPIERCPFVQTGQRVRIIHGALSGIEGIVSEVRNPLRLVLSITLLQRSVQLEVDASWIVPCGPSSVSLSIVA